MHHTFRIFCQELFLSTPSARRATTFPPSAAYSATYFYPRPPRGGRHPGLEHWCSGPAISIHALREEGDGLFLALLPRTRNISIHALREEGDRPVRVGDLSDIKISIHALREEGDPPAGVFFLQRKFLSTPSARRATLLFQRRFHTVKISIHALREEGDPKGWWEYRHFTPISIHALREEGDLICSSSTGMRWAFLSTPSARRATACPPPMWTGCRNFYPRPPRGGRHLPRRPAG